MSGNKLIAAGNSRLKKAADSAVDPAVPAELQKRAATSAAKQGSVDSQGPSVFARGRVLSADDITGTPEEQLAYITERLHEIDLAGKRAEDFTVLNKAVLLEVAQERELHLVAGYTNFSVWAADVLDVEPKYVFELLQDAARIRAISELGPDLAQHLTRASARKVMAEVIASQGLETAQVVMTEGMTQAAEQGKKRPTASLLASIAKCAGKDFGEAAWGMGVTLLPGTRVGIDLRSPVAVVSAVVGEDPDGLARTSIGRVAEGDSARLARSPRDWDNTRLGDELLTGLGAFQDGAEFADDLSEVDLPDARHGSEQWCVGMLTDSVGKGLVQCADGRADALHELDLQTDKLLNDVRTEAGSGRRSRPQALNECAAGLLARVALPLAPCLKSGGSEFWRRRPGWGSAPRRRARCRC